jgi:hypothetical protein
MAWRWRADGAGDGSESLERTFGTQGDAESWLGEFYPDLLDDGVRAVSLYEEERLVYGPMSLEPDPR